MSVPPCLAVPRPRGGTFDRMGEHVGHPAEKRVSYAEYVALAEASEVRLEYVQGTIVAMSGGTLEHARLIAAVTVALGRALAGKPCVVLSADARVRIRAADRATSPSPAVSSRPIPTTPCRW